MQTSDKTLLDMQMMWNRLVAVTDEQARTLMRTAFSTIVRECEDLSAGVFDLQGRMIAQAVTGTPGHINSMAESVKHFIDHFPLDQMEDGDAFITNDPWMGTGHLNDFVVTSPAFHNGKLVGFFSCTSHLMDIGGLGVGTEASDVHMEGLYIPMLRLAHKGEMNDTLMQMIRANTRLPVETEGDVYALVGCNDVGIRALRRMMTEFAIDSLQPLADYVCDQSSAAIRKALAQLPKGSWSYAMTTDGYDSPIELCCRLTIGDDEIALDFDGTSGVIPKGINVPLAYTKAYAVYALSCALAPEVPNNAGSLSRYSLTVPQDTILSARKPAPVACRHVIGQLVPDVVFGCLRQALPNVIPAEGTSCIWNVTVRGRHVDGINTGQSFALSVTTNGGTGGRPGKDGLSATAFPSGVHGTQVEIAETHAPLLFWRRELRRGSGGAGASKGGDGQVIEIAGRDGAEFELLAAFDRVRFPARGAAGGGDGAPGSLTLDTGAELPAKGNSRITTGRRVRLETPGGGGLGASS